MEISPALAADLSSLTDALGSHPTDLEERIRLLAVEARLAVDSYLGLAITLVVEDHPLHLTVMGESADPGDIATSARLPLSALGPAPAGSQIVFFAATAGAFVDFAADLSHALSIDLDAVVLDQDRSPPAGSSGLAGLVDLTHFNQAIGILIARGHTPEGARIELGRRARHARVSINVVAQRLIHSARSRPATEQA